MIEIQGLTKRFWHGGQEVVAVDQLTFTVAAGEVYGLLGANGAGKTTTLRMVTGLIRPDAGTARVDGFDVAVEPEEVKARLGLVSANDGVYPWLTVRETLLFFADLYDVPLRRAKDRLLELSQRFGLRDLLDRRCVQLSTGQKQRVTLARSLMHDPPAMLLDEPTRGLDVVGSKVVFDFIDELRDQGKGVIVSTHRLDESERVCDRFGLLAEGSLWQEGTLVELQQETGERTVVDMFCRAIAAEDDAAGGGAPR